MLVGTYLESKLIRVRDLLTTRQQPSLKEFEGEEDSLYNLSFYGVSKSYLAAEA